MEIYKIGSPKSEGVRQIQRALHLYPDGIYGQQTEAAVIRYQSDQGLKPDGIVGPATYARLLATNGQLKIEDGHLTLIGKKSKRQITEIIVHCTATPEGRDYDAEDIRRWHKQQGWSDIGYHYVVLRNGHVQVGRDVDLIGAHCQGHNAHSIGVVYVGGVAKDGKTPKDTRTDLQKATLLSLLLALRHSYPNATILGHRDYDSGKACPSFDARTEYRRV